MAPTQPNAPTASVVVASISEPEITSRCLKSLVSEGVDGEVLVASACADSTQRALAERYPAFHFLRAESGADVFSLRALGAMAATGDIVVLIEDHVVVEPGWWQAHLGAHAAGHQAVGGPVENGLRGARGWALYFAEYGLYMPPVESGLTTQLCGLNISYRRSLLQRLRGLWRHGLRENEINAQLLQEAIELYRCAAARVTTHLGMSFGEASSHLFSGGRQYGGWRASGRSWPTRAALFLRSFAVPFVLFARVKLRVLQRRPGRLGKLLLASPLLFALLGSWSAGEALGYLTPAEEGQP